MVPVLADADELVTPPAPAPPPSPTDTELEAPPEPAAELLVSVKMNGLELHAKPKTARASTSGRCMTDMLLLRGTDWEAHDDRH
jgi:hypothetical protein